MAENTINDFNTLPEQVQINKDDITKLKDDISKVKATAWEKRKFNIDIENTPIEFTSFNPPTEINTPMNIQKSFTDKFTYAITDPINSYSFAVSSSDIFSYVVCANPNITFKELLVDRLNSTTKNAIVFANLDVSDPDGYSLFINSQWLWTQYLLVGDDHRIITDISNTYSASPSSLLTANAINENYLKKAVASDIYLSKQDYNESIDKGYIQFTKQGWTKFETITDTEGQTITLSVPDDLLEHVQVTGTNDLILQLIYNDHAVFENVYLHPNNSTDNLDRIEEGKSTYFTGQAVLTLSTQSEALCYIVYQETTGITLHLITTI